MKGKQIDPQMDMTRDMDLVKGSKGISYWFTSMEDIPIELFKKYVKGHYFLDLGCGDGRMIRLAMICKAKKFFGIELDEKFIQASTMQRHIKRGDFCEIDLGNYDVLYYYLGSKHDGEEGLFENLKNFEGILMLYYRKVPHRLQKFQDNLINIGFVEIENESYLKIYRRGVFED